MSTASCRDASTPPAATKADAPAPVAIELKVGDPAPAFSLRGSDGKMYSLANYTGRQVVVLAWFAKAFSSA
jgi:peroxiredoxin Q/BCP